jgi:hypothetical protein
MAMSENEEKPQDPQVMYPVLQRHGGGVPVFLMSIIYSMIMMYPNDDYYYVVSIPISHMYPYVSIWFIV